MTELEAIRARHSVRRYIDKPIGENLRLELNQFTADVNAESGLDITIQYNDPSALTPGWLTMAVSGM